jgi:GH24 family phage-related lysozyme (muramidase)
MKKCLFLLLLTFINFVESKDLPKSSKIRYSTIVIVDNKKNVYEDSILNCAEALKLIKSREGFVNHKYECPAGKTTIGWGHQLLPTDTFLWNTDTISVAQGDSILKSDFIFRMNYVRNYLGHDYSLNKTIALTGYCFTNGTTAFLLNIYPLVKDDRLSERIYLSYCYYHDKTGNLVKSRLLRKTRVWEWNLFTKED